VIADNGSRDRSLEVAREIAEQDPRVRIVDASARRGNAAARNIGAEHARGELLLFTDQDDLCDHRWLSELAVMLDTHEAVGGPLIFMGEGATSPPDDARPPVATGLTRYPYGYLPFAICTSFAVRAETFRSLGGFREHYGSACDVDFSWRLQEAGMSLAYAPGARLYKRKRSDARQAFRQHLRYGADDPLLYREHRAHGMQPEWTLAVKQWVWLLVTSPRALVSQPHRESWVRVAGSRCGRLRAMLHQRVVYP
jgi:GT2 family glycosyltransferase